MTNGAPQPDVSRTPHSAGFDGDVYSGPRIVGIYMRLCDGALLFWGVHVATASPGVWLALRDQSMILVTP